MSRGHALAPPGVVHGARRAVGTGHVAAREGHDDEEEERYENSHRRTQTVRVTRERYPTCRAVLLAGPWPQPDRPDDGNDTEGGQRHSGDGRCRRWRPIEGPEAVQRYGDSDAGERPTCAPYEPPHWSRHALSIRKPPLYRRTDPPCWLRRRVWPSFAAARKRGTGGCLRGVYRPLATVRTSRRFSCVPPAVGPPAHSLSPVPDSNAPTMPVRVAEAAAIPTHPFRPSRPVGRPADATVDVVGDVSEYSELANHNFVGSYRKLVQHVAGAAERGQPDLYSFTTGMPFGLFNGTVVTGPADPATLTAHLEWLTQRGVPYRCWIDEGRGPGLDGAVRRHGLDRDPQPYPAMLMAPLEPAPLAAAGVEVRRCTDAAGYDAHIASHVANGVPAELAPALIPSSMARDPEVALFTGWVDGELVGQSIAIRTGAAVGVYAVGVVAAARRRGAGTALTWAAVDAGREWGCRAATLQASDMGLPIYERMGFGMVVPYAQYRQPPTSA